MNFEAARAAIAGRLSTLWTALQPNVPVDYENRALVDLARQTGPFIACDVVFGNGEQKTLGLSPVVRYSGNISLEVWVKQGTGTATAFAYLEQLAAMFKTTYFGGVYTAAPRPIPAREQADWCVHTILVPFYFDQ